MTPLLKTQNSYHRIVLALAFSSFGMGSSCAGPKPQLADEDIKTQVAAIRLFLAEAFDPRSADKQPGVNPLRATCLRNVDTLWLIANQPEVLAETGLEPEIQLALIKESKLMQGRSTKRIRSYLENADRSEFDSLQGVLERSLESFRFETVSQLDKIKIPQMGQHWPTFLKRILNGYFNALKPVDKKRVIASLFKNTGPKASETEILLAFVYGSGPFFQKAIQLLGDYLETEDNPDLIELKKGLANVKDKLPHIDQYDIDQYVKQIAVDTLKNGSYIHVENFKSLGAASVGQAFQVDLVRKNGDKELSRKVAVIKFMRPGIEEIAKREAVFFEETAKDVAPRMGDSFVELRDEIYEEMDYLKEVEKLKKGNQFYPAGEMIQAVTLISDIAPTKHYMAMELAPGKTLKSVGVKLPLPSDLNEQIAIKVDQIAKGILLDKLSRRYAVDALYHQPRGFFHGDLHEGNMLMNVRPDLYRSFSTLEGVTKEAIERHILAHPGDLQLTLIDFGNAHELSAIERSGMLNLFVSAVAVSRSAEGFLEAFNLLASETKKAHKGSLGTTINKRTEEEEKIYNKILDLLKTKAFVGDDKKMPPTVIGEAIDIIMNHDYPIPASIIAFKRSVAMLDNSFERLNENVAQAGWSMRRFTITDSLKGALSACLVKRHLPLSYSAFTKVSGNLGCDITPDAGLNAGNVEGLRTEVGPFLDRHPEDSFQGVSTLWNAVKYLIKPIAPPTQ